MAEILKLQGTTNHKQQEQALTKAALTTRSSSASDTAWTLPVLQHAWLMPPPSVRESRGTARMRGTRCSATVSGVSARQLMKNRAVGVSDPAILNQCGQQLSAWTCCQDSRHTIMQARMKG